MARRYKGKYSPNSTEQAGQTPPPLPRPKRKLASRARLLYYISLPMLFAGLGAIRRGDVSQTIAELGGFGLLLLSAYLLNEGLKAEAIYNERKIAKPPAIPRKIFAAVSTALAVTLVMSQSGPLLSGLFFGAIAMGAQLIAFGLDPLKKKGVTSVNQFDAERAALAIEKAETTVEEMVTASKRFQDRRLEERVEKLAASARHVFRTIEDDPRDLTRARKFLSVYLMGARDATVKFADVYSRNRGTTTKQDYESLLGDLEKSFSKQQQTLLLEDRTDLDVEIEVLRDRLRQEGVLAQ